MNAPLTPIVAVIDGDLSRYPFLERLERERLIHLVSFDDGRTAMRRASQCQASFMLVSSELPDMRGIDCVEMLLELYPDTRFYLIASKYDADEERLCFRFARVKYLCRPLDEHWLDRLLRSITLRRRSSAGEHSDRRSLRQPRKPHAGEHDAAPRPPPE